MYILVALQLVTGLGSSLFWQPIGEFGSSESCKVAVEQLKKSKDHKEGELYVCLKK